MTSTPRDSQVRLSYFRQEDDTSRTPKLALIPTDVIVTRAVAPMDASNFSSHHVDKRKINSGVPSHAHKRNAFSTARAWSTLVSATRPIYKTNTAPIQACS